MRVLLACYAERTTALPMVPIAWGLRAAGHEVVAATQPALVPMLAGAGVTVVPVGRDHAFWRVMRHVVRFDRDDPVPAFAGVLSDAGDGGDAAALREAYHDVVRWWWRLVNDSMTADLVRFARRWRPDVVVWETSTFAGAVAARASDAAHVRMVWSVDAFAVLRERVLASAVWEPGDDPLALWLREWLARSGRTWSEDLALGQATVTFLPAALRAGGSERVDYLPVRYVPYPGRSVVPRRLIGRPRRRRICVCFGTTGAEHFATDGGHLAAAVRGLAELDADVVVATAAPAAGGLRDLPGNVEVVSGVPLDALLATSDLLVSHGGPNTVATAVVLGVPQLVVPAEFDSPLLARNLVATRAGLAIDRAEVRPASVRALAAALLGEPRFAEAARDLSIEARAMPGPDDLGAALARIPAAAR
jgi:hypothetical protein